MAAFSAQSVAAGEEKLSVAVSGYDVVGYFTESKAIKGSTNFVAYDSGQTYLFSNEKHRDLFTANPTKYKPAYGGFCAMGVAMKRKFPIDPEAWHIHEGELYLNLNKDVQKSWLADVPGFISQANGNWTEIKGVPAEKL